MEKGLFFLIRLWPDGDIRDIQQVHLGVCQKLLRGVCSHEYAYQNFHMSQICMCTSMEGGRKGGRERGRERERERQSQTDGQDGRTDRQTERQRREGEREGGGEKRAQRPLEAPEASKEKGREREGERKRLAISAATRGQSD